MPWRRSNSATRRRRSFSAIDEYTLTTGCAHALPQSTASTSSNAARLIARFGQEPWTMRRALCAQRYASCNAVASGGGPQARRNSRQAICKRDAHGYRVKPHGQLVRVSSRPYGPCTSRPSTTWSRTTLQGGQAPGKSHLEASFPPRGFQRLSLPHIATRQCHWRDNRYTRGASTPVLSY